MLFTQEQLNIIDFCAQECAHQESGELSVARMIHAWNNWLGSTEPDTEGESPVYDPIYESDILDLATQIEPDNKHAYRCVPVTIQGILLGWENITRSMEMLIAAQENLTPEEFYKEFEEIHPFVDGNGRVGAILYNYLRGSLNNPIFPPNFWKDE